MLLSDGQDTVQSLQGLGVFGLGLRVYGFLKIGGPVGHVGIIRKVLGASGGLSKYFYKSCKPHSNPSHHQYQPAYYVHPTLQAGAPENGLCNNDFEKFLDPVPFTATRVWCLGLFRRCCFLGPSAL